MYFDKSNMRLLRYIRQNPDITDGELRSRFGAGVSWVLSEMMQEHYIGGRNPDGTTPRCQESPYSSAYNTEYRILPRGDEFLDSRNRNNWLNVYPLVLSTLALLISVLSLLCNSGTE